MRELLRPGGTLAIVGLGRSRCPADLPAEAAGAILHRVYTARRGYWEISAPMVWPPPETYGSVRRLAAEVLPSPLALLPGLVEARVWRLGAWPGLTPIPPPAWRAITPWVVWMQRLT